MPRASRAQAESHRREVLDAAAAQVRAHGAHGVSVPQLMAAAGLTHGGFYRHFRSKEDLVAQACTAACAEKAREIDEIRETSPDLETARQLFIERYLSVAHRDHPGQGCGLAALVGDVARADAESPLRQAYLDGLREMVDNLGSLGERSSDEDELLVEVALLAGALMLARASAGDELSERILRAARKRLISPAPPTR
ncbi:TetR/AcrR family transcriptional regulator [Nocardia sp. CDC159]|uniref:TetR/AcrR family transcriptional regulator n=1 Tax=Nocardia pulmonis TaxID=2951408 RepID=A0A9X2E8M1_9NOCA|nr:MULTISPECIES: TetR/AcrR family transcriptional regulator [Nocardia]MCM6775656.1 TetR/AcrR family transcriptional regulator [Nocardia pulmonis]MCM6788368.1 TetR/AcrR family transcriptional regulator [Nocardia sp. CDC159]